MTPSFADTRSDRRRLGRPLVVRLLFMCCDSVGVIMTPRPTCSAQSSRRGLPRWAVPTATPPTRPQVQTRRQRSGLLVLVLGAGELFHDWRREDQHGPRGRRAEQSGDRILVERSIVRDSAEVANGGARASDVYHRSATSSIQVGNIDRAEVDAVAGA